LRGVCEMLDRMLKNNSQTPPPWLRRLYLPAYSISEAAYFAKTSPQTVSHWHYNKGKLGPVILGKDKDKPLSYLQLIEVAFVSTMREFMSLQKIRKAREYARTTFNVEFPFAQLRWKTEGTHLLINLKDIEGDSEIDKLVVCDKSGQEAWGTIMAERFTQFVYEDGLALIWHLRGIDCPVNINPRISFGAPSIKGIPTWILKGRWLAGESIEEIQEDFQIDLELIQYGLEFEGVKPESRITV
jgi:uncharacterized protein (DUF433 family)